MSKSTSVVAAPKSVCPVTAAEFQQHAKALEVTVNGTPLLADVKLFSTGSFGWFVGGKITVKVDGKLVPVQVGMNLTCIGSKPA